MQRACCNHQLMCVRRHSGSCVGLVLRGAMAEHYVVFSVFMPIHRRGVGIPGYLHLCARGGIDDLHYDVYSQRSLACYPVRGARHHGRVGDVRIPLLYHPDGQFQVCHYYGNDAGTVSCYVWLSDYPPTVWAHYEVMDISEPSHWWWGAHYVFQDLVDRPPVSLRVRREGMFRFYRYMRAPLSSSY